MKHIESLLTALLAAPPALQKTLLEQEIPHLPADSSDPFVQYARANPTAAVTFVLGVLPLVKADAPLQAAIVAYFSHPHR